MRTTQFPGEITLFQEKAEKMSKKGDLQIRFFLHVEEKIYCQFENNRCRDIGRKKIDLLIVEVIFQGRRGVVRGSHLMDIDNLIEQAVSLSRYGNEVHFDHYPSPAVCAPVKTFSSSVMQLDHNRLIDECSIFHSLMTQNYGDLYTSSEASRTYGQKYIVTGSGISEKIEDTEWQLGGYVQKTGSDSLLFAGLWRQWKDLTSYFDMKDICSQIGKDLALGTGSSSCKPGKYSLIMPPYIFKKLLITFTFAIRGSHAAAGSSPLKDRRGEKIFHENINIADNPHIDYSPGSCRVSDEGSATKNVTIVEKGILKNFLFDLEQAAIMGEEPTGNDNCMPRYLTVEGGDQERVNLIGEVDDGIYVSHILGLERGNIINGDFNCQISIGYKIEKGRILGRLKNVMIIGNIYEILNRSVQLGSEIDPLYGVPYILVEGVTVV